MFNYDYNFIYLRPYSASGNSYPREAELGLSRDNSPMTEFLINDIYRRANAYV